MFLRREQLGDYQFSLKPVQIKISELESHRTNGEKVASFEDILYSSGLNLSNDYYSYGPWQ